MVDKTYLFILDFYNCNNSKTNRYEKGIGNEEKTTTMFSGIAAGATVQKRFGEKGPLVSIDYSFRPTQRPANGVHMMSLRLAR